MYLLRFDMRAPETGAPIADLYRCALEMAEWAEDKGCITVMVSQHHTSPDGYLPSPLVLASAIAARTKRVPITVGALLLNFYDPIKLAEDMIVLDIVSGGRVSYTIGLGYRPEEHAMFGVDMAQRGATMDRKLDALRAHPSQLRHPEQLEPRIRSWASEEGAKVGVAAGEAFRVVVFEADAEEEAGPTHETPPGTEGGGPDTAGTEPG